MQDAYGRWALVTGASSGIGRALAHECASAGYDVLLLSHEPAELVEARDEVERTHGVQAEALVVDLSEPDAAGQVRDMLGDRELGLLVSNASYGRTGPFESLALEDYRHMLAVNVDAYVALALDHLPQMKARGRGGIVFVSSLNALVPGIGQSAVYTATKAFEFSLACGLWQETLGTGVDVCLVIPGPTRTGFQAEAGTQVASWAMAPEEVAAGVLDTLGRRLLHIAGPDNSLLAAGMDLFSLEPRVQVASYLLDEALLQGRL
jgi:short-subunit dehydrogenase